MALEVPPALRPATAEEIAALLSIRLFCPLEPRKARLAGTLMTPLTIAPKPAGGAASR
jgi:hypothetical protein